MKPPLEYKEYLFHYSYNDSKWCFSIFAANENEAIERMTAIRRTALYDGELKLEIRICAKQKYLTKIIEYIFGKSPR